MMLKDRPGHAGQCGQLISRDGFLYASTNPLLCRHAARSLASEWSLLGFKEHSLSGSRLRLSLN